MIRKSVLGWVLSALIAMAMITTQGLAQIGEASLRVSVTDPNGAVILGARVDVSVSGSKKRTLETGPQGEISLSSLATGKCQIRVEAAGFQPREIDAVLKAGANHVQVQMEIAHIEQEILITTDIRESSPIPAATPLRRFSLKSRSRSCLMIRRSSKRPYAIWPGRGRSFA